MDNLPEGVRKLSDEVGIPAASLAEALYRVEASGIAGAKAIEALKAAASSDA